MQILYRTRDYLVIELTRREATLIGGSPHVYNSASEIYLKSVPDGTVELANAFLWQGTLDALNKRRARGWITQALMWLRTRLGRGGCGDYRRAVEGIEASGASRADEASTFNPPAADTSTGDTLPPPPFPCEGVPE